MLDLSHNYIRKHVAYSDVIYQRGVRIYEDGAFMCVDADREKGWFQYDVDGNYGDYTTRVQFLKDGLNSSCDCPYPGKGCKHTVAVLLDIYDRLSGWTQELPQKADGAARPSPQAFAEPTPQSPYLTADEIRAQALEDRRKRAKNEAFDVVEGDMYKGEHLVETPQGRQYQVTLHDPEAGRGHCTCPDFATNRLDTCKHLLFIQNHLKQKNDFHTRVKAERFPFLDIYWDSTQDQPRLFCERSEDEINDINELMREYFDAHGNYIKPQLSDCLPLLDHLMDDKRVRIQETVLERLDRALMDQQLAEMTDAELPSLQGIKTQLYPYQIEGVRFGLYKKAALIGDEMGLGKTLQAITLGVLKKEIFDFQKILVITMASLKEQWKREIERFTDEKAVVVAGTADQRRQIYKSDPCLFKLTNYEAVLRDVTTIGRFKPDLVILDEAQRIKNFTTKTAQAIKSLPRKHALVLTGTPLENKLEDVYSIVQFLDPLLLAPLWRFAADHFMLSRNKKGKILGYHNLSKLHEKLKPIVIRRRKEEVMSELPDEVVNTYYIDFHAKQAEMHAGYMQSLLPLLNKKFLTPMDQRRIMQLLLSARRVCDSTYLVDRQTNISPKLKELEGLLDELVVDSDRKVVIFSEWTTMTFLIAKHLSKVGIPYVELSGKIPVHKRQALIDEFTNNPQCKVFLSTDAGGTGLNLQAADCVINFELPWNPAKMNQRIGRVNRIGQKSQCVNVVNLVTKNSIEEKILAGIQLKTDLFKGVFDGGSDKVEFSREKRTELLNKLREMMGEQPELVVGEAAPTEEIPEDSPHYLNPKVLNRDEAEEEPVEAESSVAYASEENPAEQAAAAEASPDVSDTPTGPPSGARRDDADQGLAQSPEKMEKVLNTGMQFISGLLEMASGKKIETVDDDKQMIHIDRQTGEVTMKFRLPTF